MTNSWNFKCVLYAFLLSTISVTSEVTARDNNEAPKASVEEAKIKHWRMPAIDLSFNDIPELENAFIDAMPADMKDGIKVGELGIDGGRKELILNLVNEIAEGNHGNYDSLLISQKGKLLFESYFRRGRVDLSHPQSSATKTYTSLALGRAIQLGYLTMADLDKPLVSFLKELNPSRFAAGVHSITLHSALTMTTGIRLSEEEWETIGTESDLVKGQQEVQQILERTAPITVKTQVFEYGTGPQLVMQVIEAVVPGTAEDFIKKELFGKMGITNFSWRTAASGLPESGWRVSVTSRDMVKLGTLAMNKGQWNGEQLISEAFINKATSRLIYNGDDDIFGGGKDVSNQGYGYFWWGTDLKVGDKSYFSASAQGGGGMYIFVIKEFDLMVVVTAHHRDQSTQQLVAERILTAFVQ
jgi:CubicO group peptidase (beta-lactamase class C family)